MEFVLWTTQRQHTSGEDTGEEPSLSLRILSGLPCMGMGTCYFSLAVQIPIVSLLGASLKHGSQTAPLWSFFPESTGESAVPRLRPEDITWGQHDVLLAQWYFSREVPMFLEMHILRNRVV